MIQVTLTGALGRDAEEKEFGGNKFITFSVAVNDRKKDSNGEWVEDTLWVDVTYNNNGGSLINYLKKGTKVLVMGRPKVTAYMNRENQPVAGITVRAYTVELTGQRQDNAPQAGVTYPQTGGNNVYAGGAGAYADRDKLPF